MTLKDNRTYRELITFKTFKERYEYLRLRTQVGTPTFGFDRYLNQLLYRSYRWRKIRDKIIIRDNGCDLGLEGYNVDDKILVHHINPVSVRDIENSTSKVFDPENLICVSSATHLAIHFGDESLLPQIPIERYSGDMVPWRKFTKEDLHGR